MEKKIVRGIACVVCIVLMVKACDLEYKSEVLESIPEEALQYIGKDIVSGDPDELVNFWIENEDSIRALIEEECYD